MFDLGINCVTRFSGTDHQLVEFRDWSTALVVVTKTFSNLVCEPKESEFDE